MVSTFEAVIANPREQPGRASQKVSTIPIRDEPPLAPLFSKVVEEYLRQQAGGITFGRYGKDFRPEVLVPVVKMVTLKAP